MRLENIAVGEIISNDRIRKHMGNLSELVSSIKEIGLLHPLVVNSRKELVAGGRRLAAVCEMGWTEVPCYVVETFDDAAKLLTTEGDENSCREDLLPSDYLEIAKRIEALEKPAAQERKRVGNVKGGKGKGKPKAKEVGGKLPPTSTEKTRDKVAAAVGVSARTYQKAKQISEAAQAEPEAYGDLPAKMDVESVDAAHKELKRRQSIQQVVPEPSASEPAVDPAPAAIEPEAADRDQNRPHGSKRYPSWPKLKQVAIDLQSQIDELKRLARVPVRDRDPEKALALVARLHALANNVVACVGTPVVQPDFEHDPVTKTAA